MINQQILQGNWNEFKGKLLSKWGSLTDDDLATFNGDVEQLLGTIQQKSGEARESIEEFVEQLTSQGASAISRAGETARAYVQQAAAIAQDTSTQAAASIRDRYVEAKHLVGKHPGESLAVCFGVGLISGVVIGSLLRKH